MENNTKNNKAKNRWIFFLVGILCIVVAIVLLLLYFMQGKITVTDHGGEIETTESITCTSNKVAYPYFKEDNSKKKDLKINAIFNGGIQETVYVGNSKDVGTFTYRLAWIYERADYLSTRPMEENVFGLGLISDSQTQKVNSMYAFGLGLMDEEENIAQLTTPDISYGNLLSKYGYVGGVLFLFIWFQMLATFIRYHREDDMAFAGMLLVINAILLGFSGTTISDQGYLITPYLAYVVLIHKVTKEPLPEPAIAERANGQDAGQAT